MTYQEFLDLQAQLWWAFGPAVPWLVVAFIVLGLWLVVLLFALTIVREIAEF